GAPAAPPRPSPAGGGEDTCPAGLEGSRWRLPPPRPSPASGGGVMSCWPGGSRWRVSPPRPSPQAGGGAMSGWPEGARWRLSSGGVTWDGDADPCAKEAWAADVPAPSPACGGGLGGGGAAARSRPRNPGAAPRAHGCHCNLPSTSPAFG